MLPLAEQPDLIEGERRLTTASWSSFRHKSKATGKYGVGPGSGGKRATKLENPARFGRCATYLDFAQVPRSPGAG